MATQLCVLAACLMGAAYWQPVPSWAAAHTCPHLDPACRARAVVINPRELILPIAAYLGVPKEHVIANRMNWQWDDETGMPTKLVSRGTLAP